MHFYHAGETFKLYLEMGPSEFVSRIWMVECSQQQQQQVNNKKTDKKEEYV